MKLSDLEKVNFVVAEIEKIDSWLKAADEGPDDWLFADALIKKAIPRLVQIQGSSVLAMLKAEIKEARKIRVEQMVELGVLVEHPERGGEA